MVVGRIVELPSPASLQQTVCADGLPIPPPPLPPDDPFQPCISGRTLDASDADMGDVPGPPPAMGLVDTVSTGSGAAAVDLTAVDLFETLLPDEDIAAVLPPPSGPMEPPSTRHGLVGRNR